MTKKAKNVLKAQSVLNEEELKLLKQVIEEPSDTDAAEDLVLSQVSTQMLDTLLLSEDIMIVAHHDQQEFRFPLYLVSEGYNKELKELGPPDIIDHGGKEDRYWRVSKPVGVKVFDEQGEILLGSVVNISSSGLFMQCGEAQRDHIDDSIQSGGTLRFYLKIPHRGFHLVSAKVVRIESEQKESTGFAVNFDIDKALESILHDFILQEHAAGRNE